MKYKFPFFITVISLVSILINIYQYLNPREVLIENKLSKFEQNKMVSMLIENNQGEYEESENNEWPSEDYILNKERSGCENGGTLEYQDNNVYVKTTSSDRCYVYFAKDTMANKCELGYADASSAVCTILKTYGKDKTLFYHDGNSIDSNSDLEAGDNSYRYSGSDYEIVDKNKYQNVEDIIKVTFNTSDWINNYKLLYKDSEEKLNLKEVITEAINDGYLKENKIKNFVCIPTTIDETCSNDNLYRIIGVFPNPKGNYEIKLIKYDYATVTQIETGYYSNGLYMDNYRGNLESGQIATYAWQNGIDGSYPTGDLNLNKLNGTFLSKLDSNKIADHTWYSSRNANMNSAKIAYDTEVGIQKSSIGEEACTYNLDIIPCREEDLIAHNKIGLMYYHEYMYASKPNYWHIINDNLPYFILSNWFYMGHTELTITGYLENRTYIIVLNRVGRTGGHSSNYFSAATAAIRPTFYLKSDVSFISGDGSYLNPYKLV